MAVNHSERKVRERVDILRAAGFEFLRAAKGSHSIYWHPGTGQRIIVAPCRSGGARALLNFKAEVKRKAAASG